MARNSPPDDRVPFTLRIPPDLHAQLLAVAEKEGVSLNAAIVTRLAAALSQPGALGTYEEQLSAAKAVIAQSEVRLEEFQRRVSEIIQTAEAATAELQASLRAAGPVKKG